MKILLIFLLMFSVQVLAHENIDNVTKSIYEATEKLENNSTVAFFIGIGEAMGTCSLSKEKVAFLVGNSNCRILNYSGSDYVCCDKKLNEYLKK